MGEKQQLDPVIKKFGMKLKEYHKLGVFCLPESLSERFSDLETNWLGELRDQLINRISDGDGFKDCGWALIEAYSKFAAVEEIEGYDFNREVDESDAQFKVIKKIYLTAQEVRPDYCPSGDMGDLMASFEEEVEELRYAVMDREADVVRRRLGRALADLAYLYDAFRKSIEEGGGEDF